MFKKEIYINYFREIQKIEEKMIINIEELKQIINDPSAREILESIYKDEQKHIHLEEHIIKTVKRDNNPHNPA